VNTKLVSAAAVLAVVAVVAVVAGCGSSSSGSKSSSGSSSPSGASASAGAVTPAMAANPSGSVTWCIGKDTTGAFAQVIKLYEQANPKVRVHLLQLPTSSDQQRTQLVQREQAKSPECDVLGMDVIWTAEFAAQGWLKNGSVPQSVLTYMEEQSRDAFQTGKVSILRNWPYVYSLAKAAHVPFKVEPLPTFAGGKPAGVLGGYNLGISKYSKNPGAALSFINFATGPAAQAKFFIKSSLPAVLTKTYSLPAVVKSQPFAPQLLKAVEQAQPRPISPVYPQISQAIYKNVYSALSSGTAPATVLQNAQSQINAALKTF
jgi:ABC-type glycerol-3-phosphate transport system substrate-binding protein